ncbi:hypothetical protein DFJ67_6827 [Asanoa ferruginea]|uniref:DoxX-like protein n=1 Tax=Asanoa ferruginea TaxID=53367 RepID=A0A3D9ZUY5_9ACTN|nr:hypothetical protein [Asanoa ferruginea]REG00770.1 hypothetical protein DFJ67_6827 [Asanoa ferruginea]GIF47356.1 hypothetical protein Afe04nite_18950 [Asanoa ferruginea]
MTVLIRIALAILFLDELLVGFWNQAFPESFYNHFPTVTLTPPFSEHYARDFGGATLGLAVVLGIALVSPRAVFTIPAAAAYSVFAVPHFFFHLTHLDHATVGQAVFLTTANAVVALLGLLVIVLTLVRDASARRERPRPEGPPR